MQHRQEAPAGGHGGIKKTLGKFKRSDVEVFVKSCPTCQETNYFTQPPAGLL